MYKAFYKYELARLAGVSTDTMRRWCNESMSDLIVLGYRKTSHLLPPSVVKYLCEKYCIDL